MNQNPYQSARLFALVAFMWFAYFLNYGDRQAVFAMFGSLRTDLQMSDRQLGLTGSIFLWVYGLGCPIAGRLADHYSKKRLVVLSLIIWSIVTLATGFANSAIMLLCLRAAMGISESLYMPAAISLTANATPPGLRSRAVSILTTGQIAGTVAGSWFGGYMAQQGQWREAFFCLGIIGVIYAIPYFRFLSSIDENRDNQLTIAGNKTSATGLFSVPSFCMLCVGFPIFVFGLWMLYSWLPSYLQEKFSLDKAQAGFEGSFYMQVGSLAGLFLGGFLADILCKKSKAGRFWLLVASLGLCSPFMHLIGASETLIATRFSMLGFGLFGGFLMGNIFPASFDIIPAGLRASAVGYLNFFGAIISGFAPLVVGNWKQSIGIERMLTAVSMVYLAGAFLLIATIQFFFAADWAKMHEPAAITPANPDSTQKDTPTCDEF
ncbi:MAG: MFS transporter [Isosphaeraceae bacterium]